MKRRSCLFIFHVLHKCSTPTINTFFLSLSNICLEAFVFVLLINPQSSSDRTSFFDNQWLVSLNSSVPISWTHFPELSQIRFFFSLLLNNQFFLCPCEYMNFLLLWLVHTQITAENRKKAPQVWMNRLSKKNEFIFRLLSCDG